MFSIPHGLPQVLHPVSEIPNRQCKGWLQLKKVHCAMIQHTPGLWEASVFPMVLVGHV
jgi:hypothetical protein